MWIASAQRSAWLQQGSTCWDNGCGDNAAPSCDARSGRPAPTFSVARGERLRLAVSHGTVRMESLTYMPLDAGADDAAVPVAERSTNTWHFRAPNADALLTTFIRGDAGGDASYAICIRIGSSPRAGTHPIDVTTSASRIPSRAVAELLYGIDVFGGAPVEPIPGSLRCERSTDRRLSSHAVWHCNALMLQPGAIRGQRETATMVSTKKPPMERRFEPVQLIDPNVARGKPPRGLVAVRGLLVESGGDLSMCVAGYVSLPPSCGDGALPVTGIDPATFDLDRYAGGGRFTRAPVVVFGRLGRGTLRGVRP